MPESYFQFQTMMIRSTHAVCVVLLLAAQQNVAEVESDPEVLAHPSSLLLPEGKNATFHCILQGQSDLQTQWLIDGSIVNVVQAMNMGFVIHTEKINNTLRMMSLTVPASQTANFNMSEFSCQFVETSINSKRATLTVYEESPFAPNPMITAHNETFLSLIWSPLFLWPGFSPVEYNVMITSEADGRVFLNTSVDTNSSMSYISSFITDASKLNETPETCSLLNFTITPIGPSFNGNEAVSVSGGYPKTTRDYEVLVLNSTVYFYQNSTPAHVLICIQLPYVCDYEELLFSYTVSVALVTEVMFSGSLDIPRTLTFGPTQYQHSVENVVCERVVGLTKETRYSTEVMVETETGSNITSPKHFFDTKFMTEVNGGTTITCSSDQLTVYHIATGVSVGIAVMILMTCILSVCLYVRKRHTKQATAKDKTKAPKKILVHNPIYDGPIYDTIHQEFNIPQHVPLKVKAHAVPEKTSASRYLNGVSTTVSTSKNQPIPSATSSCDERGTKNHQNPTSSACEQTQDNPHDPENNVPNNEQLNSLHTLFTETGTPSPAANNTTESFKFEEALNLPSASSVIEPDSISRDEVGYTVMHPVGNFSSSLNGGWGEPSTSLTLAP